MQSSISSLIAASEDGDQTAARTLFTALYSQLHRVAQRQLARGGYEATLGPTTLLHEAYLDIAGRDARSFPDEARFLRYASRVMRGLIIEHARRRHAQKRGGAFHITAVDVEDVAGDHPDADELCP